jgi:hypothetical protein
MGQHHAIGIDNSISARDRFKSPWSRDTALRHAAKISCIAASGPSAMVSFGPIAPGNVNERLWRDVN